MNDIKLILLNRPNAIADFDGSCTIFYTNRKQKEIKGDWNNLYKHKELSILKKIRLGNSYILGSGYLDDFKNINKNWTLKNCGFDIILINNKNCNNLNKFKESFKQSNRCDDWRKILLG